jgi:hypothetical protein
MKVLKNTMYHTDVNVSRAFLHAINVQDYELVKMLISQELNVVKDEAMSMAIKSKNVSIIRLLFEHFKYESYHSFKTHH